MIWCLGCLLLFPLLALIRLKWRQWEWPEAGRLLLVFLAGLMASGPFLTDRAIGTGEAYNYSLAVADTIAQLRHGIFPVATGQSEYAFNGRIHPLRTAVYFTHVCGLLDALTWRQLPFWQVQNLSLALSLMGAAFSCYLCLRMLNTATPTWAALLACWYANCPSLLAAAYGIDLYMTVTTAPFIPLALLGACLGWHRPAFSAYLPLAVGLAGCWLAHPPVAAWVSLGTGLLTLAGLLRHRFRPAAVAGLTGAALLGAVLAAWAFAAVFTLGASGTPTGAFPDSDPIVQAILAIARKEGWQTLLPVSQNANLLADFQLGYAGWLMLAAGLRWTARTRSGLAASLLASVVFLVLLMVPVPYVSAGLWRLLPDKFIAITNVWAAQRVYLVASAFLVFGFAAACAPTPETLPPTRPAGRWRRIGAIAAITLTALWSGLEAAKCLRRGYNIRHTSTATQNQYRAGNLDLALTSYAFLPVPDNFRSGARDPELELRLLALDEAQPRVLIDNAVAGGVGQLAASGTLRIAPGGDAGQWLLEPALPLRAGRRYRLRFEFLTDFDAGSLLLTSQTLTTHLPLGRDARPRAFGVNAGQTPAVPVIPGGPQDETARLSILPGTPGQPPFHEFARYHLEEIDATRLPLRIVSLVPHLVCEIDAPEAGWLETPRAYLDGYTAKVDGNITQPRRGSNGLVLLPVPAGHHRVEVNYITPRSLQLAAFASVGGWLTVVVTGLAFLFGPQPFACTAITRVDRLAANPLPVGALAAGLLTLAGVLLWHNRRAQPEPLRLKVAWPVDRLGQSDPLVTFGTTGRRTAFFVRYLDRGHLQLGFSAPGPISLLSEPLPIDYAQDAEVMIAAGAFYAGTGGKEDEDDRGRWLRSTNRIWLNGREVLTSHLADPADRARNLHLGLAPGHDGSIQPVFGGRIVNHSSATVDCPIPSREQLAAGIGPLRLRVRLPTNQLSICEPLLSFGDQQTGACLFVHYVDAEHIRLGLDGPGTSFMQTPPLPHDYAAPLEIALSLPALFPPQHPALTGYSRQQEERLARPLRVMWRNATVLRGGDGGPRDPQALQLHWGTNAIGAKYPGPTFTGAFLASDRVEPSAWPVPPGRPEDAVTEGSFGPLELAVRFPIAATGRIQPLLTTGRASAGSIVLVHYLDERHIRLGIDVWGRALFWSPPLAIDYDAPHRCVISTSALFPSAAAATLPPERLDQLRAEIRIGLDGATAVHERAFAYDTRPAEITPGQSLIGGSYNEPAFTGEILSVRRLPPPSP